MFLNEFVEIALLKIKKGVNDFNEGNEYKAYMPNSVSFDVCVNDKNEVVEGNSESYSRIKFTVEPAHYPHLKNK